VILAVWKWAPSWKIISFSVNMLGNFIHSFIASFRFHSAVQKQCAFTTAPRPMNYRKNAFGSKNAINNSSVCAKSSLVTLTLHPTVEGSLNEQKHSTFS
jgi:hypothetical protein